MPDALAVLGTASPGFRRLGTSPVANSSVEISEAVAFGGPEFVEHFPDLREGENRRCQGVERDGVEGRFAVLGKNGFHGEFLDVDVGPVESGTLGGESPHMARVDTLAID